MRWWTPALALALVVSGCASSEKGAQSAVVDRDVEPTDVFPADLDLVVRIDLGRMREGIGPAATAELAKRALQGDGGVNDELREALACAEVVWLAAHAAEIGTGDRVIAIEGKSCMPELASARWERTRSHNKRVRIFDRRSDAHRAGTARIMNLGNKTTVFVSPVELDAVKRVLADGPDPKRGNPTAEGVVSLDLRARPLAPGLAKKYPSIAAVLGGIDRVRGSAKLGDEGLAIDVEVLGKTAAGAAATSRFLEALRDSLAQGSRFGDATRGARVELVERTVQVKLTVPPKVVLGLLSGGEP
jgi:hypothetical protein